MSLIRIARSKPQRGFTAAARGILYFVIAGWLWFAPADSLAHAQPELMPPEAAQPGPASTDAVKPELKPDSDQPQTNPAPKSPAGPLPWESAPRPRITEPILRLPGSPREILERYDIGPSQLDGFFNGQPLGPGEEDVLAKILFRFPRMALENIERWRKKDVSLDQLAASPGDWRAEFFPLKGRVKAVEKQSLLPELAALFEFDHYYRVTIDLDDSPYQALVCTRRVPPAWKPGEPLDEPARCDGLFLKLGDQMADEPQLVFAARGIGWFPESPRPEQFLGPDQLTLARAGFDVSLLDDVRATNRQGIGDGDREGFYQLLNLLGRADPKVLHRRAETPLDVVPLLQEPEKLTGQFMPLAGVARRVMRVPVNDADVRIRFGIDHYYEIDLFIPIGDKELRFGKAEPGKEVPVYSNNFPATLICRKLPPGLREGDDLRDPILANAVFFKLWTYRSGYSSKFGQLQPAPLFLAIEPRLAPQEPLTDWISGTLVSIAFGLALLVIVVFFWWFYGTDKAHSARQRQELAAGPPDFAALAAGNPSLAGGKPATGEPAEGLPPVEAPQTPGPATNAIQ